ncbi:recombinase family protein [Nocardiopsis sp. NPDC049922]|uniref:recombinase family protein n=1 Tax=Nocardiopsis sp. NPDC049922 TaxID=3155157 RepID=UPI0033F3EE03
MSTTKQDLTRQIDALNAEGIDDGRIWVDKKTGATVDRDGLEGLLAYARPGDTVVAHTLYRRVGTSNCQDLWTGHEVTSVAGPCTEPVRGADGHGSQEPDKIVDDVGRLALGEQVGCWCPTEICDVDDPLLVPPLVRVATAAARREAAVEPPASALPGFECEELPGPICRRPRCRGRDHHMQSAFGFRQEHPAGDRGDSTADRDGVTCFPVHTGDAPVKLFADVGPPADRLPTRAPEFSRFAGEDANAGFEQVGQG